MIDILATAKICDFIAYFLPQLSANYLRPLDYQNMQKRGGMGILL